jgi:two-component system sensor histidine kinase BaeS
MRIQNKLFVAFLLAGISLVALMFVLMQWSLTKGLLEFINTKERDNIVPFVKELKTRYQQKNNWDWIKNRNRLFHNVFRDHVIDENKKFAGPPQQNRRPPPRHRKEGQKWGDREPSNEQMYGDRRPAHKRGPSDGPGRGSGVRPVDVALFDQNKTFVVGRPGTTEDDDWQAIKIEKKIIGWLVIRHSNGITRGYELTFLEQQRSAFIIISLLLICLTIIIAMPLARNLVHPIKQLVASMNRLTNGDYKTRVKLNRTDELGRLGRDVNELAVTLEKNETARKRWLANISHELRTPISVLKGEMEAVIDGVRPVGLDHVESSYQEVQRLQRLVEDLYELTSADIGGMKYRKEEFDLVEMLNDELAPYSQILKQSNITLTANLPNKALIVWADADRLCQLFKNIMVNCAKYAATGGQVRLSLQIDGKELQICIEDNGSGVAQEHLAELFEHLYRVDSSRDRKTGGSGLGLAICKQIVEGHQGSIVAQKSELGGLAVIITLPIA